MTNPAQTTDDSSDAASVSQLHMQHALELAAKGLGRVEPNPMVGCVIAQGETVLGEGWHETYGGPHAEVMAVRSAGEKAKGATLYVTLEPCCHQGKTPPCAEAVIAAGIGRVVIAMKDPFPQVAGKGIETLQAAGITVETGVCEKAAQQLLAPYLKLVRTGRPWIIAKWAMTLDGKIATRTGSSQWISGEPARAIVHELRGRMDAILVGRHTQAADDPLLTARPAGQRTPVRIVLDTKAQTAVSSQLVQTANETPVLIACGNSAPQQNMDALTSAGCEVYLCAGDTPAVRLESLLDELGRRRMTNLLVEGGSKLLGSLRDLDQIDEIHTFIAPKLLGQADALPPIAGQGAETLDLATLLEELQICQVGDDAYLSGRVSRSS